MFRSAALMSVLVSALSALSILFNALAAVAQQAHPNVLKQGFLNPPDSVRPGVYWYFMDGNISATGMTKDLESMKKAGIGQVLFLEVNVGVPQGPVDFLSTQW